MNGRFGNVAKVAFLLAAIVFVLAAAGADWPDHPVEWGLALVAAGLLLD